MSEIGPFWAAKETFTSNDATDLTTDDTTYDGAEIDCDKYSYFLLLYDISETGVLVNNDRVRIIVEFRQADGTWHEYMNGPFGALYEEQSTTPCTLCVSGICIGERMRIALLSDYTNADPTTNYFTVTSLVTLMR